MGRDIAFDTPAGSIGAWRADPVSAPRGGIAVVQEIFGVNPHVRSVADRYAGAGDVALAPAFFDPVERGVELDYDAAGMARGRELVTALGMERAVQVLAAAADLLRAEGLKVGVVGFWWGGTVPLFGSTRLGLPASSYSVAGNLPFVGEPWRAPMHFQFGEDNPSIPPETVAAHRDRQPAAAVFTYPGTAHAFNREVDPAVYDAGS